MMAQLNQILAVEGGVKSRVAKEITRIHHNVQKDALLNGITRDYSPKDDDGDRLPSEHTKVQVNANTALEEFLSSLTDLFDVTATKDWANTYARADVVVDGHTLVSDAPATYLLFLEKQLNDVHTFVSKLPTLDPSETWTYDPNAGAYRTEASETTRTKKVPRNHVKAEATDRHPAQVEMFFEDTIVGYWKTVKFSGAFPAQSVRDILDRVVKLQDAVKRARQEANTTAVEQKHVAMDMFEYILGGH
jgi:hypothetical protein